MKRDQDAHGLAWLDAYRGEAGAMVVERDDGYAEPEYSPSMYFDGFAKWSPREKKAMKHVRGRVLDAGCGPGRHALYLQKKGLKVTGIDVSPGAIEVCRLRGVRDARMLPATRVSRRLGIFDTIIMMGNNFGLFGNARRARWLLRRFHAVTSDRGRIVAECVDPYGTKNPYHLRYHRRNRRRGRMSGQLRIRIRYRTHATPWFDYLFVSRKEMRELVRGTGWRVARFIQPKGGRYVAVLEKTL